MIHRLMQPNRAFEMLISIVPAHLRFGHFPAPERSTCRILHGHLFPRLDLGKYLIGNRIVTQFQRRLCLDNSVPANIVARAIKNFFQICNPLIRLRQRVCRIRDLIFQLRNPRPQNLLVGVMRCLKLQLDISLEFSAYANELRYRQCGYIFRLNWRQRRFGLGIQLYRLGFPEQPPKWFEYSLYNCKTSSSPAKFNRVFR